MTYRPVPEETIEAAQPYSAPLGIEGLTVIPLSSIGAETSTSWLIKGVLPEKALAFAYGPPSSGKTFWAIDLAYHVASGTPWNGCRTKTGGVLYFAAEGNQGIAMRLLALRKQRNSDVPFWLVRGSINLFNPDQVEAITASPIMSEVSLIVIDTLAAATPGAEENAARDMGLFLNALRTLQEINNAAILIIHHPGKTSDGMRGSSALLGAADTVFEIREQKGNHISVIKKQKDGEAGQSFAFKLQEVSLGVDEDGDSITSCTVVHENAPAKDKQSALSRVTQTALAALSAAIKSHSEPMPPNPQISAGIAVVREEFWKKHFVEMKDGETIKAFKRARDTLVGMGIVNVWNRMYWIPGQKETAN